MNIIQVARQTPENKEERTENEGDWEREEREKKRDEESRREVTEEMQLKGIRRGCRKVDGYCLLVKFDKNASYYDKYDEEDRK